MIFKPPARPLSARLRAQRDALVTDTPGAVAAAADTVHRNILKQWPSPEWGASIHPYATGLSLDAWELTMSGSSGLIYHLRNDVPYAQYTERGYTKQGPETARSWSLRGFGPYSSTALSEAAPAASRQLTASIDMMVRNNV